MRSNLFFGFSLMVVLILLMFQESLRYAPVCDTDANCEAWAESVKLDYRGVVD